MPPQRKLIPLPDQQPLAPLVERYLTACEAEGLSANTLRDYRHRLHWYERYLEAHKLPATTASLSLDALRGFVGLLRGRPAQWHALTGTGGSKPLSPFTVRGYTRVLKGFSRWLADEGVLPADPLARFAIPRAPKLAPKTLTDAELAKLLDALGRASARDRAVVLLMLGSGLRLGELSGLTLAALGSLPSGYVVVHGKGDKERLVPVDPRAADAIQRYLRERGSAPGALFLSQDGGPLTASGAYTMVGRLGERTGITGLHPHRLRHTLARLWITRGGDAVSLQHVLGHSSIAMTAHYARLWGQDVVRRHRELNILGDFVTGPKRRRRPGRGDLG